MAVFTVAALTFYGVSVPEMALFGVYLAVGLTFPGMLLVRALYAGKRTLAEEIALGLTTGYAVELFAYIAACALGRPLLVLAWPVTVYALFLTVPSLRTHLRGTATRERTPLRWSWALALIFGYLLLWSAGSFFRTHALTWPGLGGAFVDMPFHLALTGELRNHVPPTVPMVAGEPLAYHWFVYAHLASASWITGIEPMVLLFRLAMLPMLAAIVVLVAMTGRRMTGSHAGGALVAAVTVFVAPPSLYLGTNGVFTWGGVTDLAWTSPTQTFGSLIFTPVVLLLFDLLERRRRTVGRWLLLGLFLAAVMGAKATYLPLLGAGLVAVAVVETIRRRRPPAPVLAALAMTAACFAYAQFVLFGRHNQATVVSPFAYMRTAWDELTGLGGQAVPPQASVLGLALVFVLCWTVTWGGILGLLTRPRLLLSPQMVLMLGMAGAGLGTMFLLGHPTRSQLFFLWGAYPYLATLAVCGIIAVLRNARTSLRAILAAACAGTLAVYLIPVLCGVRVPLKPGQPDSLLYRPYLALLAVVVLVAVLLWRRTGARRACALTLVMCAAIGLPADLHSRVLSTADRLAGNAPFTTATTTAGQASITYGALAAGRWLRDHSDPDDLVATNDHCILGYQDPCDSRHFWVAALAERRVLVEGWAYTATNLDRWRPGMPLMQLPFWDEERLRLNEAVFDTPSAATLQRLRERYGVRWLVVDERRRGPETRIGDFADLRFRSGEYAVYRMRDEAGT
ncbi:hypothetical protein AB0395_17985 [Streptosporangium sp. NPDC051023]|uniref:hypothetical protein n=1 Tax=Streptosporangium sp. NPDC051023 TaxID=3155410 RepID=UPI00344EE579